MLANTDVDNHAINKTLSYMQDQGANFADLYFQVINSEEWMLEDSIVKHGSFNLHQGVGVRALWRDKTGFAYSDIISKAAIEQAAKTACSIIKSGKSAAVEIKMPEGCLNLYPAISPLSSFSSKEKVELLKKIDKLARAIDPKIVTVIAKLSSEVETILLAGSDGVYVEDVRPLVRLNVIVVAEDGSKREQGSYGGGARCGYEIFTKDDLWQSYVKEATRIALTNLQAKDVPAGKMDVVLGAGWPGILFHEAVGHGLEADFNRKGASAFAKLMGEKVAASNCTLVDDGTLFGKRGSLNCDDEGVPTQNTVLIENGVLKNYMQDKLNAKLMNMPLTGNGRRESYAHIPIPRMTNTYMLPGDYPPEEIIASIKKGLYAVSFGGGQVDITSGKFVFVSSEAYWVENGKICYPVKGATLMGDGPTALHRITMVGNNLQLDNGVGTCGKDGQEVPVCVGQPTLRINGLTVGGNEM